MDHLCSALQALQAWAQEVHVAPKYAEAEDFQHRPGQGAERQGMVRWCPSSLAKLVYKPH